MEEYPLNRNWTLWEHRSGGKNYQDNLSAIGHITNVIQFWQYWTHLPNPSEFFYVRNESRLLLGERDVIGFSIFEEGVTPCWEDPKNINGGEWRIRKFKNFSELDNVWNDLVLMLIGEDYDEDLKILGIRVVDSSNKEKNKALYNIEVWFEDTEKHTEVENLIKTFDIENTKFYYREHKSSHEK